MTVLPVSSPNAFLVLSPRGPCAPGRLASLLGFQHSVTLPPGYLHLSLPPRTVSSPTEDEFYIPPKKYMKVTAVISSLK